MKTRLINQCYFYEKESLLVTAGVDGCYFFQLQITCRYSPGMAIKLDPRSAGTSITLLGSFKAELPANFWIEGIQIDSHAQIMALWRDQTALFFSLTQVASSRDTKMPVQSDYHINQLCQLEDKINHLIISKKYNYFITGSNVGELAVWKFSKSKVLIHQFENQIRGISSLTFKASDPNIFVCSSFDGAITINSLDSFSRLYYLKIQSTDLKIYKFATVTDFVCAY